MDRTPAFVEPKNTLFGDKNQVFKIPFQTNNLMWGARTGELASCSSSNNSTDCISFMADNSTGPNWMIQNIHNIWNIFDPSTPLYPDFPFYFWMHLKLLRPEIDEVYGKMYVYIYIYTCQMRLRIWGSPTFEGSPFVQNKNMWNGWCYTETTSILLKSIGILVYQTWNVGFLKTLGKPSRWSPKSLRSRSFTRKHAKAMWFCAVTGRRIFRCMWICYSKFMEMNSTFESFLVHFGAIKSIDIICNP